MQDSVQEPQAAESSPSANGHPAADDKPVEPEKGGYKTRRGRSKAGQGRQAGQVAEALKLPKMRLATMKLKAIKVRNRIREDMGDIAGLAETIRSTNGLLHPMVVRPDEGTSESGTLVAGERRFRALELLGVEETEVRLFTGDKADAEVAEAVENIARKPFTPTESWNAATTLEKALRRKFAAEGKGGTRFPAGMGEKDALLGKYVGMDASTFAKLRQIMEAHQKAPKKFAKVVEDMEESGSIDRAFRVVRKAVSKGRDAAQRESPAEVKRRKIEAADKDLGRLIRSLDDLRLGTKYKSTWDSIRKDLMAAMPKVPD